ncbi:hypothetical protein Q2941_30510 [Bradyrhizobium sp. UFLA05-153]
MPFDVETALQNVRAIHWRTNARTHQTTEINQEKLDRARELQLSGDYAGAKECVEADPNWKLDARAWRLVGLIHQGLARYEGNPKRKKEHYDLSEKAAAIDRGLRVTQTAEADVNLAATLLDQKRYNEALDVAMRARDTAPHLPTAHVAILAIYNRQRQKDAIEYLDYLAQHEAWIFENTIFRDHLATDPDLAGLSARIHLFDRS